jgi:hypothetical protein
MKTFFDRLMTQFIRKTILALVLGLATAAFGDVPPMKVIVSDAEGNLAFKGTIGADATFATGKLPAGDYVVQFNSRSSELKDNQYVLVVSAGRKKVKATDVSGDKFTNGGVAMKVKVGRELRITGQVAQQRMVDGKRYVWVAATTGSNLGGHWAAEGQADARPVVRLRSSFMQRMQDYSGEGSMVKGPYKGPTSIEVHEGGY